MVRVALAVVAVVLALAVAGQLLLPGAAERRLRSDLREAGEVLSVRVSSFPAVELLLGHADRVDLRMGEMRADPRRLADLVDGARRAGRLDARAERVLVGPLVMHDARLVKRGGDLRADAAIDDRDIAAALPSEFDLRPIAADGDGLVLEATAPLLGSVRARLFARAGAVVVAPEGLLGGVGTLTVFQDPRLQVIRVGARERPGGYVLTASGRFS